MLSYSCVTPRTCGSLLFSAKKIYLEAAREVKNQAHPHLSTVFLLSQWAHQCLAILYLPLCCLPSLQTFSIILDKARYEVVVNP